MISVKNAIIACAVAICPLSATSASAVPLVLDYTVNPVAGNLFRYDFTLRLANQDGTWSPGQQWDWIVFGDANAQASPIADFSNFASSDIQAIFAFTSGGHNGPTIAYGSNSVTLPGWEPTAVGSSLTWSGNSAVRLGEGQLLFSTLVTGNGALRSDFQVANLVSGTVPEPATWAMTLVGFGIVGFGLRAHRSGKVTTRVTFA